MCIGLDSLIPSIYNIVNGTLPMYQKKKNTQTSSINNLKPATTKIESQIVFYIKLIVYNENMYLFNVIGMNLI